MAGVLAVVAAVAVDLLVADRGGGRRARGRGAQLAAVALVVAPSAIARRFEALERMERMTLDLPELHAWPAEAPWATLVEAWSCEHDNAQRSDAGWVPGEIDCTAGWWCVGRSWRWRRRSS